MVKNKEKSTQVAANLRRLADKHNLSTYKLAAITGLQPNNITRVYSGTYSPNLAVVFQILDCINEIAGTSYTLKDVDVDA